MVHIKACMLSHVLLFMTPWTVACQAPLPMGFSRQEYWSELPFPPPGDLAKPGIKPISSVSPALVGGFFTTSATWEAKPEIQICFVKSFTSILDLKDLLRKETTCYTHNEQSQYLREDYLT